MALVDPLLLFPGLPVNERVEPQPTQPMSMATLEREILAQAKLLLNNPELKMKDILEWSTGTVVPRKDEIKFRLPQIPCNVCVAKANDKRPAHR